MSSKLFLKVTNKEECHNKYPYKDGLNKLEGKFNDNPGEACVPGRLYFCKPKHIHKYFNYGVYLREVYLPTDNPDFKMIKDPSGKKYGANMIILGKKYFLGDPKTWEFMNTISVKFEKSSLDYIISKNYIECLKYLISIDVNKDLALIIASKNGNLDIVKYLISLGANIHAHENKSVRLACKYGHLDVVKFLVDNGAIFHSKNNYAIKSACDNGHINIVKYLIECGIDIRETDNYKIKIIQTENDLDIFLIPKYQELYTTFNGHTYEWTTVQFPSYYDRFKKYVNTTKSNNQ
ncbi:putative ankyrin repeat protein [Megavirus lba]|uniref:Putative ankyrin repeat protein n=1 Tax=Megavirus lba TaxID=1235314 RepID=L7Y4G0_9VIRU|nr:putative ankyrin repeat protein [Megavirus lba]